MAKVPVLIKSYFYVCIFVTKCPLNAQNFKYISERNNSPKQMEPSLIKASHARANKRIFRETSPLFEVPRVRISLSIQGSWKPYPPLRGSINKEVLQREVGGAGGGGEGDKDQAGQAAAQAPSR